MNMPAWKMGKCIYQPENVNMLYIVGQVHQNQTSWEMRLFFWDETKLVARAIKKMSIWWISKEITGLWDRWFKSPNLKREPEFCRNWDACTLYIYVCMYLCIGALDVESSNAQC